ncbi:endo-1,3-beta-glucanase [Scheffersomyces coipomensis]|uniref:endo-1,3-beta-glucanase n=1 Tax=Scheffersomyces coipomensis TaxID=1788519 RepID=UPI00315CD410
MLAKFALTLLAIAAKISADDVTTVTETNYVTVPCIQQQVNDIFTNNPTGLTTGIPIVIVYANPEPTPQSSTITTTEEITITVSTTATDCETLTSCSDDLCVVKTTTYLIPTVYTTVATTEYTTIECDSSTSEVFGEDLPTIKSAPTTSITLFHATTSLATTYTVPTTLSPLSSKSDPVRHGSAPSKSLSVTIDPSKYTTAYTYTYTSTITSSSSSNTLGSSSSEMVSSSSSSAVYYNSSSILSSSSSSSLSSSSIESSSSSEISSSSSSSSSSLSSSSYVSVCVAPTALFEAISTEAPPSIFPREDLPLELLEGVSNNGKPFQTNKFYNNIFLGDQTSPIYANPYILFWKTIDYYGFGVYHTNTSARVFGSVDTNNVNVDSYFFNPVGNAEIIFSAESFTAQQGSNVSVSNMEAMSVLVELSATPEDTSNVIQIPIVQGMGFTTAIYYGTLVPQLNTLIGFQTLVEETSSELGANLSKYRVTLYNGVEWLIYVTTPVATDYQLNVVTNFVIEGLNMDGLVIQVAIAPTDPAAEALLDSSAGTYTTDATVGGSVDCEQNATYSFDYATAGSSKANVPIVYALPHHISSLSPQTAGNAMNMYLSSSSEGQMQAFFTNQLILQESLEVVSTIGWFPWSTYGIQYGLTPERLQLIASVANHELSVDIAGTVAGADSNYYSGKILDKYAYILLVVSEVLQDANVTAQLLDDLKTAFQPFLENTQFDPLMYDTRYLGVTATANNEGDTGADFGSGYYNDHHFHYGYFVHAAAVVGYIDQQNGGTWAEDNKDWVNSLIRDVANPSAEDTYFPISRMFEWYGGHSWAAGLFESGDGKNEESSSEDFNFSYGMKMWANVVGDESMEARANLMLAITSRAMNDYYYYQDDNTVEPIEIIPNKVSGIIFENKIDYTTYFGSPDTNPEYVHGIHMLPITPVSSFVRLPVFVQQEWEEQISTFIDNVDSGWTGILYLNQGLYDPNSSWGFFSSDNWSDTYLDDGQSRTWSLTFTGAFATVIHK